MIHKFNGMLPVVQGWIAHNATVIGNVTLEKDTSVFFHTTIRGDKDEILIKEGTNIQDGCVLHTDTGHKLVIEENVTVGHGCILHGCHIEKEVMVGMGAIIMNGAHIGKHCIVGAGCVITEHKDIPENSVVVGNPARILKEVTLQQIQMILENAKHYIELSKAYQEVQDEYNNE